MTDITRRTVLMAGAAALTTMTAPALAGARPTAAVERTLVGHGIDQLYDAILAMPYNGVGVEHIKAIYMTPAEYNLYIRHGMWRVAYEATYQPDTGAHGDTVAYLLDHGLIQVRDPQAAYDEGRMREELAAWERAVNPNRRTNACYPETGMPMARTQMLERLTHAAVEGGRVIG